MSRVLSLAVFAVCLITGFASIGVPANAQETSLSAAQTASIKAIQRASEKKAAPLALKLASTAKKIYENMLSDREDERLRAKLERELDGIGSKLIKLKGQSIREMVAVLTPEQKALVRMEMRKPGAPADLSELIIKLFRVD